MGVKRADMKQGRCVNYKTCGTTLDHVFRRFGQGNGPYRCALCLASDAIDPSAVAPAPDLSEDGSIWPDSRAI